MANRRRRRIVRRIAMIAITVCAFTLLVFGLKEMEKRRREVTAILNVPRNISAPSIRYSPDFDGAGNPIPSAAPTFFSRSRFWLRKYILVRPFGISWDGAAASDADLKKLLHFPDLKQLDLEYTTITDEGLGLVAKFTKLERLDLQETQITDSGLRHIAGLRGLRILLLGGSALSDQCLVHVTRLENLQSLALRDARISGEGLENLTELPNLTSLDLQYSSITDAALPHLSKLKRLTRLSLIGTKVSSEGVTRLKLDLPQCEIKSSRVQ